MLLRICFFFLGICILSPFSYLYSQNQIWTDSNGQKIEAAFVRANENTVTISMDGQEIELPLSSLSPFSKALAIKMRNEAANGGGDSIPVWTDTQGRKIRAKFVRADASSITLDMDGSIFQLPLDMLDVQSMRQAFALSQSAPNTPPPPASVPQNAVTEALPSKTKPMPTTQAPNKIEPVAPTSSAPKGTDPDGPLDLYEEQVWISDDGRPLKAKFVRLNGEDVVVMMGNNKELDLPLNQLGEKSQKLAQKLEDLRQETIKKLEQFTQKRLAMKVPSVTADDLKKIHSLTNVDGASIEAVLISANDEGVALQLSGKTSSIHLPWNKFSEETIALLEGLRRLKQKMAPKVIPAKANKLEYFSNGNFAGYNRVQQSEFVDSALSASGSSISIWLKPKDSSLPKQRFTLSFKTGYTVTYTRMNSDGTVKKDKNGKPDIRRSRRSRKIVSFDSPPPASTEGGPVTLKGTFDNKGTFQYDILFKPDSILLWSKMKEPKPPENHSSTNIYISVSIPGIVTNSINRTQKEIDSIVGDGFLLESYNSGNSRKFPYRDKWITSANKYKGKKFGGLSSMKLSGFPFEKNSMVIRPVSSKSSGFSRSSSYGKVAPYQGYSYYYRVSSQEIPKGQALKVSFSRD